MAIKLTHGDKMIMRQAVRFSSSVTKALKPREYYFVDTNIILGYMMDQYPGLKKFVDSPDRKFFYTETVKAELIDSPRQSFSSLPFHFVNSGLSTPAKDTAIKLLYEMWEKKFEQEKTSKKSAAPFMLTDMQRIGFHNDLFIVFEAGIARYLPIALPQGVYKAELLTNNLKLYKKFIQEQKTKDLMEKVINLAGFEHLIDVETMHDVINKDIEHENIAGNHPSIKMK